MKYEQVLKEVEECMNGDAEKTMTLECLSKAKYAIEKQIGKKVRFPRGEAIGFRANIVKGENDVVEKVMNYAERLADLGYIADKDYYICPVCEKQVVKDEALYCPNCGQKIDWSYKD